MAKLLGTAPNQAPTNADLGDLAYQDAATVASIGPISFSDGDVAVDTDTLFVDTSTNRVGIGTSAPLYKLHVAGDNEDTSISIASGVSAGNQRAAIQKEEASRNLVIKASDGATPSAIIFNRALNTEAMRIDSSGNLGIATSSPTQKLDVNDDSIRVRTAKTPASASDTGTTGQIAWDADYIYVCTATDTWKRVAIATW